MSEKGSTFHCPLCCNETFDSLENLKNHLVHVKNNLKCTMCGEDFQGLQDLIDHLDHCSNTEDFHENSEESFDENVKSEDGGEMEPDELSDDHLYYCEICELYFLDIEDHLTRFHLEEEVILDSQDPIEEDEESESNNSQIDKPDEPEDFEQVFLKQDKPDENGKYYAKKTMNKPQNFPNSKPPIKEKYEFPDDSITLLEKATNLVGLSGITVYRCQECQLRFSSIQSYNKHICYSNEGAVCGKCMIHFTSASVLKVHKRKIHGRGGRLQPTSSSKEPTECDICHIMFPSSKSMVLHRMMHTRAAKPQTIDPPVTYNMLGSETEEENNQMFTCTVCNKKYNKHYEDVHMKSHTEELYNCPICNKQFTDKSVLDMHAQAHGNDSEKKISCTYCKKTFMNEKALTEHVENQCKDRDYACSFCGRKFARPHEKVTHERIHTGDKPHICEVCGKGFRVGYCLTLHLRTHTGVRPYHCETCGKRFKGHGVYKHHLKTHSEERPYKCTFCPKAFKTGVQLAGHKNTHTKPFSCNICNRPFASLYNVRIHMKSHEGNNNLNYQCHICGAEYARNFALRDHLLTHPEISSELADNLVNKKQKVVTKKSTDDSEEMIKVEEMHSEQS